MGLVLNLKAWNLLSSISDWVLQLVNPNWSGGKTLFNYRKKLKTAWNRNRAVQNVLKYKKMRTKHTERCSWKFHTHWLFIHNYILYRKLNRSFNNNCGNFVCNNPKYVVIKQEQVVQLNYAMISLVNQGV